MRYKFRSESILPGNPDTASDSRRRTRHCGSEYGFHSNSNGSYLPHHAQAAQRTTNQESNESAEHTVKVAVQSSGQDGE
jgi:hypothetical protein